MELSEIIFQYYLGGINSNTPKGNINLLDFVRNTTNPSTELIGLIDNIERAKLAQNTALKTYLKEQLPFITPSVIVNNTRKYADINCFTGVAQLDFDKVTDPIEVKHYIFETYPAIICAYLSPSKQGVKALIRIPVCETVEEYQSYYRAITTEFSMIDGFDPAPKNAVLPMFQSYDYFALVRYNPSVWESKEERPKPEHISNPLPPKTYDSKYSADWKREKTERIFVKKIRDINSATGGHPNVRSASLILGTRVGYGYISYSEAVSLIEREINSNGYLSKDTKGYLKTAYWGLSEGMKTPNPYR